MPVRWFHATDSFLSLSLIFFSSFYCLGCYRCIHCLLNSWYSFLFSFLLFLMRLLPWHLDIYRIREIRLIFILSLFQYHFLPLSTFIKTVVYNMVNYQIAHLRWTSGKVRKFPVFYSILRTFSCGKKRIYLNLDYSTICK